MATVASLPQPAHLLGPHAYPVHHHQHQRVNHQQNGFGAFHHHHRGPSQSPASFTTSWREHAPAPTSVAPAKSTNVFAPRRRSASPSWRHAAVKTPVPDMRTNAGNTKPHADLRVYSIQELLALASSPLVGVNPKQQTVLTDITEHWVWRRGAHTEPKRSRRSRSPRSTSPSTRSSSQESS
ncbi:unnamed protein product [Peniophora sp. CBMAI 1063]|nr:unnamed protein product [Peniophora sp. CBMAI 1063]